jgi:hypothetical protein
LHKDDLNKKMTVYALKKDEGEKEASMLTELEGTLGEEFRVD